MDENTLIQEMMKHGHSESTARSAIAGRGIADLWREYVGNSGSDSSKTPEQLAQESADAIINAAKQEIERETKFLEQYTKDNPFVFDEQAARESAQAEYDPYYKNLLDEYTKGVDISKASIQDQRQLLTKLNDLDTKGRTANYEYAIRNAEDGYAGQGLFFSGINASSTGRLQGERNNAQEGVNAQYGVNQNNVGRQEQNIALNTDIYKRQQNEAKQGAIESGILQRQKEAQEPYYGNFVNAYKRAFPTGNLSVDAYLPVSYRA